MNFRCLLLFALVSLPLTGCHSPVITPAASPVSTQPVSEVPKNQILVQFETMDCPCALGDINAALMELQGVSSLKWDYDHDRVYLIFLDERRPTDEEITSSIRLTPVVIKKIEHP